MTDPDRVSAYATDYDIPADNITSWKWYRSSSMSGTGTVITGADMASYTPTDTPNNSDVDMYLRAMATYTDRRGGNKEAEFVSPHRVQATRTSANRVPEFAGVTATRRVVENTDEDMNIGGPVAATDADGDVLTYSLAGTDVASFSIDKVTGQIKTKAELDYEERANKAYAVTVTATDSTGAVSGEITVTINITDENEKPMFRAGDEMAPDRAENTGSLTVSTYTAEDPEMGSVTLSLSGDDSGMFELNDPDSAVAGSKVLAFKSAPDFENPADSNRNNIYEVTVEASDGTNTAMRDVTVKVTDSDENGKVTLSTQQPRIGVPITATLADPDGSIANVIWEWERDDNTDGRRDQFWHLEAIIDKATSDTYTPVRADNGMHLRARATYIDRTYDDTDMTFSKMATSASSTQVRGDTGNNPPEFDEGSATERFRAGEHWRGYEHRRAGYGRRL